MKERTGLRVTYIGMNKMRKLEQNVYAHVHTRIKTQIHVCAISPRLVSSISSATLREMTNKEANFTIG